MQSVIRRPVLGFALGIVTAGNAYGVAAEGMNGGCSKVLRQNGTGSMPSGSVHTC